MCKTIVNTEVYSTVSTSWWTVTVNRGPKDPMTLNHRVLSFIGEAMVKYEKMSKSRGNVVTVDEVVNGVFELKSPFEFRAWSLGKEQFDIIDHKEFGVWRDTKTGCYFAATKFKKFPVFLCEKSNPVPLILNSGDAEIVQHDWHPVWPVILNGIKQ